MNSLEPSSIVSQRYTHLQSHIVFICKHCKILSIKYLCISLGTLKRFLIAVFHAVYNMLYIFTTAHFAEGLQLWVSLKFHLVGKTLTRMNTGSNPLYPSFYKPSYLASCSTTQCQKNYSERPQIIETINNKKKENQIGKKMEGNL